MYSFSYLEPVCCSMSSYNCCFLTCIQVSQESGQMVWYSHLFQNFPQFIVIHTVKGFGIIRKAEIDVFLELSCFFDDPADVGNLISGSSAFSKTNLNIWKFTLHLLLKPGLEDFGHYFISMWHLPKYIHMYLNMYTYMPIWEISQMAQRVKNLPAMQKTQEMEVQSLDWENPWRRRQQNPLQYYFLKNPMDGGAWGLLFMQSQRVGHDWVTKHMIAKYIHIYANIYTHIQITYICPNVSIYTKYKHTYLNI